MEALKSYAENSEWLTSRVVYAGPDAKARRIEAKAIGAGLANFRQISGSDDVTFYVPSKDELDALYNFVVTSQSALNKVFISGVNGAPWWTSSEASDTFAWYQLFNDGTQFTDANGIVNGLAGNKTLRKSNVHKGSSFPAKRCRWRWCERLLQRESCCHQNHPAR
ncbi:MAG: hypothetical protein EBQ57_05675 [Actinobacteria bacterium]|nr:hypothetical protein [Actinomycetota bacterium]